MVFRIVVKAFAVVGCCALFACTLNNNTALPPAPNNPAPVVASVNEAANDAHDALPCAHNWDIGTVAAQRIGPPGNTYTELIVSLGFEQEHPNDGTPDLAAFSNLIAPGTIPAFCDGSLEPLVAISTGPSGSQLLCFAGAQVYPNLTYIIDLAVISKLRLADGNAAILSVPSFTQTGEAQISGGGNVVNFTVPLSAIGGTNGSVSVAALALSGSHTTDCGPEGGELVDAVARIPLRTSTASGGIPIWGKDGIQILEGP